MFNIDDLIIYSAHGICRIDDIVEREHSGVTKTYYILHPIEDPKLKISTPVDNDKVIMLQLLNKEEAEIVIESFELPGIEWIDIDNHRSQIYSDIVKTGNRKEISMVVNTLMRQKIKIESVGRKFHIRDKQLLDLVQNILFAELAYSLNTTSEAVNEKITSLINEHEMIVS